VLSAQQRGLAPALAIQPLTHKVMLEKNIDLGTNLSRRSIDMLSEDFDLMINMSGQCAKPLDTPCWIEMGRPRSHRRVGSGVTGRCATKSNNA
jgi:protein-tyrosine-phosphatase